MDNRVTVEFQNNQHGKPKVSFEGTCEDYKESDAVLFFDGQTCRLERLHRAVKRLRHVRLPGESAAAANFATTSSAGTIAESYTPSLGKRSKVRSLNNDLIHQIPVSFHWLCNSFYLLQVEDIKRAKMGCAFLSKV